MDTSAYTHMCRAGHAAIIRNLAPDIVLIPTDVNAEIERGREQYPSIPAVHEADWAAITVLTEAEVLTQAQVKAQMSGKPTEHLGECAVIACAYHRDKVAIIDERAALAQADRLGVISYDTLWIVIEAYKRLYRRDRKATAQVVDDLLGTGMRLPFSSGESVLVWAYENGLLP